MTLFFFVVALELERELVLGELRSPRMAAFSIAAALGGMLVPAALYLTLQLGREGGHGWGTVMATDAAFVIGCLALPPRARSGLLEKETLRGDELPMLITEPGVPIPAGARATQEAPNEPAESRREAADRRDLERAEDEGMTVRRR